MSEQNKKSRSAFTILEVLLLLFIIGVVVLIAIPNYCTDGRGGPGWKANGCINNLRQIDAAANQFALVHQLTNGDKINFPNDLTPYIKLNSAGKIPPCPSGGTYYIGRVGKNPICSLSTLTPAHALQ